MTCQTLSKAIKISVGADAPTLYTLEARYPRIIHSELMTHRLFSRNARSSRAVPFARLVEEVMDDPFIPRYWGKNQKGMQAGEEHSSAVNVRGIPRQPEHYGPFPMQNRDAWLLARDNAVIAARAFDAAGYHKQIVNRLLEPFMHIDVLITTTDIKNFLWLRDDAAAEPHIRDLARVMAVSIAAYGPAQFLAEGQWHLPYVSPEEQAERDWSDDPISFQAKLSVTRCARISYKPFHGEAGDIASEIARYNQLVSARPCHASPLEHQATPDRIVGQRLNKTTGQMEPVWEFPELHGNLQGWKQLRKSIPGERA